MPIKVVLATQTRDGNINYGNSGDEIGGIVLFQNIGDALITDPSLLEIPFNKSGMFLYRETNPRYVNNGNPTFSFKITANDGYEISPICQQMWQMFCERTMINSFGHVQVNILDNSGVNGSKALSIDFYIDGLSIGTADADSMIEVAFEEMNKLLQECCAEFGYDYFYGLFVPGANLTTVGIGIYTDGEESAAGGSVQVTYPINNNDVIETKTETITSASTISVGGVSQDYPFIITPIPNEGYELETFYGDGEVNITNSDLLKDAYNIHFIRSDSKWEGDGSESSPYKISNKPQLARLANVVNNGINFSDTHFEQTANIRIGGSEWIPIGKDYDHSFQGHYNGNGYKIQGITINCNDYDAFVGLFGVVKNGTIENITLDGGTIKGLAYYVGSIVGYVMDAHIMNCTSNIILSMANTADVGGIVGTASYGDDYENSQMLISGCIYTGEVSNSDYDGCGGIAGTLSLGKMIDCIFAGVVSGKNCGGVGGLVGWSEESFGEVINCISEGNIIGTNSALGGLCGRWNGNDCSIYNCAVYGYIKTGDEAQTGTFVGIGGDQTTIVGCSFSGTCNVDDIGIFYGSASEDWGTPTINACYVWLNNYIKVYSDDTSDWGEYYGLAGAMNKGLPMQRSIFAIVSVSPTTTDDILALFSKDNGWTKFEA